MLSNWKRYFNILNWSVVKDLTVARLFVQVTLVNNLELYGINLTEFARECQHGVAASTTINTLPNAKSAQLQIQGNQVIFVHNILTGESRSSRPTCYALVSNPGKERGLHE